MKKLLNVFLFSLIVVACSNDDKDPLEKAIKDNIVIEVGLNVELSNVIDGSLLKNAKLVEALENANVNIDYENNVLSGNVDSDKVFATNKVIVEYTYKNKDLKKEIAVSIKDTKKPKVILDDAYYLAPTDSPDSKETFIEKLAVSVEDNGKYSIDLEGFETIDFNKVGEYQLTLIAIDEAKNKVEKEITLIIGNDAISFDLPMLNGKTLKQDKTLKLIFPNTVTSYYDVTLNSQVNMDKTLKGAYTQEIILQSDKKSIKLNVLVGITIGDGGIAIDNYYLGNFNIALYDAVANTDASANARANITGLKETDFFFIAINAEGIDVNELKKVIDLIAKNSYQY